MNSRPTPQKPASQAAAAVALDGQEQQHALLAPAQLQRGMRTAAGSSSTSAGAAQHGLQEPSASGWASGGWEASCGGSSEDEAELPQQPAAEQPQQPHSGQQQHRAQPLLPGLPLVRDVSPQPADAVQDAAAAALPLEPALVEAEQAALQQGQVHTLFDLAALDMSELMAG